MSCELSVRDRFGHVVKLSHDNWQLHLAQHPDRAAHHGAIVVTLVDPDGVAVAKRAGRPYRYYWRGRLGDGPLADLLWLVVVEHQRRHGTHRIHTSYFTHVWKLARRLGLPQDVLLAAATAPQRLPLRAPAGAPVTRRAVAPIGAVPPLGGSMQNEHPPTIVAAEAATTPSDTALPRLTKGEKASVGVRGAALQAAVRLAVAQPAAPSPREVLGIADTFYLWLVASSAAD